MVTKSARLLLITIIYFGTGLFYMLISFSNEIEVLLLLIGLFCIILSFGLFKLWNFARIAAFVLSAFFLFIYGILVIGTIKGEWQGWGGIGLIVNFPMLILSLLTFDYLNRPDIKEQFKIKEGK